ncbi:hypothetical protein BCO18175_01093 [Burkholderia contaminans]|uniref:AbiEi antitoxin N-terminal domain-containing protein n=1 Tax=Burkholderia contaminans TaxID=488447 RepID=A0A3N8QXV4_9BURK|nr:DUF6088 family protein [Burkholderia contaminans]RQT28542.1 hypothetical protein DF037_15270 [Burkholderia contaminans]VWC61398.1 hypothetical protein BCO18175_01093 [Burkholderia contaminans]
MKIRERILQSLRPRRDGVLLRADVNSLGSASQVSTALRDLCRTGLLERLARGVYARPEKVASLGRAALLARAQARMRQRQSAAQGRPRRRSRTTPTARHVKALAREAGVQYVPTFGDHWAAAVTRLAGDEVNSDATDDLLVALTRAGKLSPSDLVRLVMAHHRGLKTHV